MAYQLPASALLSRYDRPVPRYTSYPTAPHFGPDVNAAVYAGWLSNLDGQKPVSLYFHLPYCASLCFYCGCNMKVTHNAEVMDTYLRGLRKELAMVAERLGRRLKVSMLHLGGGTPTYMPPAGLELLLDTVHRHFDLLPGAEMATEADPRHLSDDMVATLARLGFNRASLGIQDTTPAVQKAINRVQPQAMNLRAVEKLRAAGINAINLDMIYGLPLQTPVSAKQTVTDVLELRPDRIAVFGYAHVPWMKRHQVVLEKHGLPDAPQRLEIFNLMANSLLEAGYEAIGFDHFAKPNDALSIAAREGRLHRNFMGYTPDDAPALLGFGASAISQLPQGFAQNMTPVADYLKQLGEGELPVARGIAVNTRDKLVQQIIEALTCNFACDLGALTRQQGVDLKELAAFYNNLQQLMADGLAELDNDVLRVTERGRPFVRVVAACFDEYLGLSAERPRHSRAV